MIHLPDDHTYLMDLLCISKSKEKNNPSSNSKNYLPSDKLHGCSEVFRNKNGDESSIMWRKCIVECAARFVMSFVVRFVMHFVLCFTRLLCTENMTDDGCWVRMWRPKLDFCLVLYSHSSQLNLGALLHSSFSWRFRLPLFW